MMGEVGAGWAVCLLFLAGGSDDGCLLWKVGETNKRYSCIDQSPSGAEREWTLRQMTCDIHLVKAKMTRDLVHGTCVRCHPSSCVLTLEPLCAISLRLRCLALPMEAFGEKLLPSILSPDDELV